MSIFLFSPILLNFSDNVLEVQRRVTKMISGICQFSYEKFFFLNNSFVFGNARSAGCFFLPRFNTMNGIDSFG